MSNKIGNQQFHVMCKMWGVDQAAKTVKRMGMTASKEQIEIERNNEAETNKRWNNVFKSINEED